MSAARAIKTTSATRRSSSRPILRVVDHRQLRAQRRRRQAMLAIFVVVLAGFFAVATAHAELVSNQRDLDVLRNEITTSRASNAVLQRKVDEASSPEAIVTRAEELGMVRAEEPVYLIADGPVREPTVPVLMQPPPPEEEIMVAAARTAAESSSNDVETSAFAGSRAVSVGVEAE